MFKVFRSPSHKGATISRLYLDDVFVMYFLEDEIREIPGAEVGEWKIQGKTAIPSGTYKLSLETSPRFGEETLTIHDVEGFTGIRIHAGNTIDDTAGCPCTGFSVTMDSIIGGSSLPALKALKKMVRILIDGGESPTIQFINPGKK